MDRDEAFELLEGGRAGIAEWNRRREVDDVIPDLSEANLSGTNLNGVDLCKANLSKANLRGATLYGARLLYAKLSGANLSAATVTGADLFGSHLVAADLYGANLAGSTLSRANLKEARLNSANLFWSDFNGADLSAADLSGAQCSQTIFANVDLSNVTGLDSVSHLGPSTIGTDTIFRSKGNIPEAFLRGCGVPESVIINRFDLIGATEPIQFHSCFISYSSKDEAFADLLHSRMVQEKLRVWYAPEDMRGGRKSIDQIDQAIHVHDKLLLVLSKATMGSSWVLHEIKRAVVRGEREKRQILFPIGLVSRKAILAWSAFDSDSGMDIAELVREYHIPDFSTWKDHDSFEAAFARLLKDLAADGSIGPDALTPRASRRKTPH